MIYDGDPSTVVTPSNARIDAHAKWFPNVTLNFAENVLYTPRHGDSSKRSTANKEDSKIATVEVREGGSAVRPFTWKELRERVSLFASAMRAHGLVKGDRVAVVMGNSIDCLCVFLAATSVGGLFSSSSTDMGSKGILERLRQVKPKWVFVDDGALYNGKTEELAYKMKDIIKGMEGIEEFRDIVSVPRWEEALSVKGLAGVVTLESYLSRGRVGKIKFERVPFGTGFLIVYSSGTTGQPKCIVHSTGGVILSSLKEGGIHREMNANSRVLQYTTTGTYHA
jgi:acetoacetyl-CoA synthetase